MFLLFWIPLAAQAESSVPPLPMDVQILSDKVYPYSYFDVLFKTPFSPEENVRIREVSEREETEYEGLNSSQVLRTERIGYSRYRDARGRQRRAFILGFSTLRAGLHLLPRLRFEAIESGRVWYSPTLPFAAFQVDEGELALPVDVSINTLPETVYLGQNILLDIRAERVETIDQSFLPLNPEFRNFLVQNSPNVPEVQRLNILGEDVYQISLASWLLNPIEPGLLQIPAISASIMGRERKTLPYQIKVLTLPPNPYLGKQSVGKTGKTLAIGQFSLSFELRNTQVRKEAGKKKNGQNFASEFAEDARIHAVLRISGSGNIHILSFPTVNASLNLVLLQSEERDELDASEGKLSGWRERELVYRAKSPGNYQLRLDPFYFFDPKESRWRRENAQKLMFTVVNPKSRSYYPNLKDLHFSRITVFASNVLYGLQKYAFYGCLGVFLLTSLCFLLSRPQFTNRRVPKLNDSRLVFLVLGMVLIACLYSFALRKYLSERQYHFSGDTKQPNMPGNLPNLALSMYRDSRILEALEVAYLYYFHQPLFLPARRLVSSLRIAQGLSPTLPGAFFWALQLRQTGRYLALLLLFLFSAACIFQKRRVLQKMSIVPGQKKSLMMPFWKLYRTYAVFAILLLFALIIPWRFSLAVNIAPNTPLMPIPSSAGQVIEVDEGENLQAGELVKVSGRIEDTDVLVVGEERKKGWVESQSLFFLLEY